MMKPQFSLSKTLLDSLLEVERLYGKLEAEPIPQVLLLDLTERNIIQSSYSSTRIEGNPLSKQEVTNLILGGRVPANRDEKEIKNYFDILSNLHVYTDNSLDANLALELHKRLLTGVDDEIAGELRNEKVVVGSYAWDTRDRPSLVIKHEPPFHTRKKIEEALKDLSRWVESTTDQPLIKAGIFHHHFQYLHPFVDGNGRVGRIMTAIALLQEGYEINRYFVLDDYYDIDRAEYSDRLHSADDGDETEWLEYFVEGVKYSLQSSLSRIDEGLRQIQVDMRPTRREREVLTFVAERREVTTMELARALDVSRQQAHKLLASLVEKGYVTRKGETKGAYYKLV